MNDHTESQPDEQRFIEVVTREGNNLQTLLNSLPECVKVITPDGQITYVNQAGLESLGAERVEQVAGVSILDLIAPEYHDRYRQAIADVFAGNTRTLIYETAACNSRVLRWVRSKVSPLRNADGKVTFMLAITRDITDRMRMEERLEDYEIQVRTIIDSAPEGVVLHSRDGRIMDANPAARSLLHMQSESGLGESIFQMIAPSYYSVYQMLIAKVFSGEKGRIEVKTSSSTGDWHWLEIHAAPLHNRRSEVMGLLGIVQDVTERKTREEQVTERTMHLAHAHRLNVTQELARLIAHEINQPLCAISSYAEMCRDGLTVSDEALVERREDMAELVNLIGHHASRVNDVIRKMRELVRKRPLEREHVDLSKLISEVVEMFEPIFRKHHISLRVVNPQDPLAVSVDAIEIEQVLVSLLRNSIEALSRKRGNRKLEIRSTVLERRKGEPSALMVDIRDNGPGIPESVREKVLRPYLTTKSKGLGLGLSLSRSIIEMHDGEFWIEKSTGDGATIHFTLPISATRETGASCESSQPYTSSTMTRGSAT